MEDPDILGRLLKITIIPAIIFILSGFWGIFLPKAGVSLLSNIGATVFNVEPGLDISWFYFMMGPFLIGVVLWGSVAWFKLGIDWHHRRNRHRNATRFALRY